MSRRDYLKYLGFKVAIAKLHIKELKQPPPMTPNDKLPETAYLKAEVKRLNESCHQYSNRCIQLAAENKHLQQQAQRMAQALEELVELKRLKEESGRTNDYMQRQPVAWTMAATILQKWKDGKKEVQKPEPTISKCGSCGTEGINQYLGSQLYLCDGCFEHYENSLDQP